MKTEYSWKGRHRATGIVHGLNVEVHLRTTAGIETERRSISWCGQHMVMELVEWIEMPHTAVITCMGCLSACP